MATPTTAALPPEANPDPFAARRWSLARRIGVWVLAAGFTLLVVHWSARNGRLAQDATYDDVGYMEDAVVRLRILDAGGVTALMGDLVHHAPHSPFSTLLALASFEFLGLYDWAPYVFNGFVLAAFLFFCARILRPLPGLAFACILGFCLTIPLAFRTVHDFRPDSACALATAAFVWFGFLAVLGRNEREEDSSVTSAGLLLGAALWTKPPVFAHTVAIALVVGACIAGSALLAPFRARGLRRSVLLAVRFGVVGLLTAAPYYLVNGRQTLSYFWANTHGSDAHIWNFQGSTWSILRAFTVDGAEALFVGRYLWVLLACVVAGLGWAVARRRYDVLWMVGGVAGVSAVSLTIFVAGRHNSEYFGLFYELLLLAAALSALSAMICEHRRATVALGPALLLLGLTPPVATPQAPFWQPAAEADPVQGWNRKIVLALAEDAGIQPGTGANVAPIPVFVCFTGFVGSNSMHWLSLKERLPFVFTDLLASGDPAAQLRAAQTAAYVVVSTPNAQSVFSYLPSAAAFPAVLASLLGDPEFQEIKLGATTAPPYRLFRHTAVADQLSQRGELTIDWPVTGFLPVEGPYPQWQLPKVRWSVLPRSTVTVTVPQAGNGHLRFIASGPAGASVKITLDDQPIGEHVQKTAGAESSEAVLPFHAGKNVVAMDYQLPQADSPAGGRAFLFRDFELTVVP